MNLDVRNSLLPTYKPFLLLHQLMCQTSLTLEHHNSFHVWVGWVSVIK